jgi:hypothetical protein
MPTDAELIALARRVGVESQELEELDQLLDAAPRDREYRQMQVAKRLELTTALADLRRMFEVDEWQDVATAPTDGTEFLAALTSGWVVIASATQHMTKGRYQWWRSGITSLPYEPSHPADTDWSATNTVRITCWRPIPTLPAKAEGAR